MRRQKMSRGKSRANFRRGAKTKGANLRANPMRGGWRM